MQLFVVFIVPSLSARWNVDVTVVRTDNCRRRSCLLLQAIKLVPIGTTVDTTGGKDCSSTGKVFHVVLFVVEVLRSAATAACTARAAHAVTVMPVATTTSAVMVMMVVLVVVRIRFA